MPATFLVDDPADPRVGVYLALRDHQLRMERERTSPELRPVFIAEGERLIAGALDAGLTPVSMLRSVDHPTRIEAAFPPDVPVYLVARPIAVALTGLHIHRGALACFLRPPGRSLEDVAHTESKLLLVAEHVTNPTNLGVMARSAAGLGFDGLVIDQASCDPLYRRAHRVAMGAALSFPWTRVTDLAETLPTLRSWGFTTVAMALTSGSVDLETLPKFDRVALVVGNEFHGLSDETLASSDVIARIPMTGGVDSLNVAAAAAVACWAITRARVIE
jgi:tRNA G18 (ribose-2'-O)-methylase SpoU